jgi:hypothetical protein
MRLDRSPRVFALAVCNSKDCDISGVELEHEIFWKPFFVAAHSEIWKSFDTLVIVTTCVLNTPSSPATLHTCAIRFLRSDAIGSARALIRVATEGTPGARSSKNLICSSYNLLIERLSIERLPSFVSSKIVARYSSMQHRGIT